MIVDIGCPKSLMGAKEFKNLVNTLSEEELNGLKRYPCFKKFKFGPSKIHEASFSVKLPLRLLSVKVIANFYVLEGDIPILIGNDILEALGGVIHTNIKKLEFNRFRTRNRNE